MVDGFSPIAFYSVGRCESGELLVYYLYLNDMYASFSDGVNLDHVKLGGKLSCLFWHFQNELQALNAIRRTWIFPSQRLD